MADNVVMQAKIRYRCPALLDRGHMRRTLEALKPGGESYLGSVSASGRRDVAAEITGPVLVFGCVEP
jgi:hypothetical protein